MTKLLAPLALLATLSALPAAAQEDPADQEIIVVGRALDACLARKCAPAEDIKASLRFAETLFLKGKYERARVALRSARNRVYARRNEAPAEYADLMRATGTVARHLGEQQLFHDSAVQARRVLTNNRPAGDPLRMAVSLEVGDMYLRTGDAPNAENVYRDVAAEAHAAGNFTTEAAAMLRLISLQGAKSSRFAAANVRAAQRVAADIAARPEPVFRRFDPVARMMVARIIFTQQGDARALDAAVAAYSRNVGPLVPVIAYSAPPRLGTMADGASSGSALTAVRVSTEGLEDLSNPSAQLPSQSLSEQWVDVSFWVRPDGRVEDAAIMRQSKRLSGGWDGPVLASVATRRYVPLALEANDPGLLRIERYTFTAPLEAITGSRIRGRNAAKAHLVMADLSPLPKQP